MTVVTSLPKKSNTAVETIPLLLSPKDDGNPFHSHNTPNTSIVSKLVVIIKNSTKSVRDGYAASLASIVSVFCLMWLRTTMSYQYVHGCAMTTALRELYNDGGLPRFYQGIIPALLMMPLSRFGDVMSNNLSREFFGASTIKNNTSLITAFGSTMAALWRISISPIDTIKTQMQVYGGSKGLSLLMQKVKKQGIGAFYEGSLGSAAATWVGHYPWFVTFNTLNRIFEKYNILDAAVEQQQQQQYQSFKKHIRRAIIGLCSSLVSDVCSNSIRVIKTYKQTSSSTITYLQAIRFVIAESGLRGLLFRGLSSKLFSNALNSILFTVVWKIISDELTKRNNEKEERRKKQIQLSASKEHIQQQYRDDKNFAKISDLPEGIEGGNNSFDDDKSK